MSKYLVDTHILLWAFCDPQKISKQIQEVLTNGENDIYYSPINLWEIAIKYQLKKLNIGGLKPEEFYKEVKASFFQCLPLDESNIITSYQLPMYHKDPFDRALVWEAIQKSLVLLSTDSFSDSYINDGLMVIH